MYRSLRLITWYIIIYLGTYSWRRLILIFWTATTFKSSCRCDVMSSICFGMSVSAFSMQVVISSHSYLIGLKACSIGEFHAKFYKLYQLQVSGEGINQKEASTNDTSLFSIIFNYILSTYSFTYRLSVALSNHQRRSILQLFTICQKCMKNAETNLLEGF